MATVCCAEFILMGPGAALAAAIDFVAVVAATDRRLWSLPSCICLDLTLCWFVLSLCRCSPLLCVGYLHVWLRAD